MQAHEQEAAAAAERERRAAEAALREARRADREDAAHADAGAPPALVLLRHNR
jgi:hypothetical protein